MRVVKFLMICILTLAATGCGKIAEKAAEKAMEKAIETAAESEGGDVDVDISGEGLSVKGTDKDGNGIDVNASEDGMSMRSGDGSVNVAKDGTVTGTDQEGKAFKVTHDGDTSTITTEDGTANISLDGKAKLPDNFPKDVPVYTGMAVVMARCDEANGQVSLAGTSKDSSDAVASFYKKEAGTQGWTEENDMNQGAGMRIMAFAKDGRKMSVILMGDAEITNIQIGVEKE